MVGVRRRQLDGLAAGGLGGEGDQARQVDGVVHQDPVAADDPGQERHGEARRQRGGDQLGGAGVLAVGDGGLGDVGGRPHALLADRPVVERRQVEFGDQGGLGGRRQRLGDQLGAAQLALGVDDRCGERPDRAGRRCTRRQEGQAVGLGRILEERVEGQGRVVAVGPRDRIDPHPHEHLPREDRVLLADEGRHLGQHRGRPGHGHSAVGRGDGEAAPIADDHAQRGLDLAPGVE